MISWGISTSEWDQDKAIDCQQLLTPSRAVFFVRCLISEGKCASPTIHSDRENELWEITIGYMAQCKTIIVRMGPLPSKPRLQSSFFSVLFTKNLSLNVFTEYNIFSYMLLIKEGDICCLPNRLMALKSWEWLDKGDVLSITFLRQFLKQLKLILSLIGQGDLTTCNNTQVLLGLL